MTVDEYERISMAKLKQSSLRKSVTLNELATVYGPGGSSAIGNALNIAAFYNAVQDKAETIGQLPVKLFRRLPDGTREQITSGRYHRIFTKKPCEYLTMQGFLEMLVGSLETNGAFYAYKERNDRGAVMAIIPFKNQRNVTPAMDTYGNVYFNYVTNDGKVRDPYAVEDLVVINKMTTDGFTPVRPIIYQATLLGIAKAQDESYKELQENGITSQMGLATDNLFNDPNAINRLKEDWGPTGKFRGPGGQKRVPIFENGLKPVKLSLTPQEADLLNNKLFTTEQIYNMVGVPHYRMQLDKLSKDTLPQLDEYYMRNKLNPIIRKFEEAWNEFLPEDMFVQVDRKAFYAGSPWRLVEHVEKEVKGGLATINEGREDLGREPVEGGDVFAIDNNNVTYGTWPELPAVREQINGRTAGTQQTEEGMNDENS